MMVLLVEGRPYIAGNVLCKLPGVPRLHHGKAHSEGSRSLRASCIAAGCAIDGLRCRGPAQTQEMPESEGSSREASCRVQQVSSKLWVGPVMSDQLSPATH